MRKRLDLPLFDAEAVEVARQAVRALRAGAGVNDPAVRKARVAAAALPPDMTRGGEWIDGSAAEVRQGLTRLVSEWQ